MNRKFIADNVSAEKRKQTAQNLTADWKDIKRFFEDMNANGRQNAKGLPRDLARYWDEIRDVVASDDGVHVLPPACDCKQEHVEIARVALGNVITALGNVITSEKIGEDPSEAQKAINDAKNEARLKMDEISTTYGFKKFTVKSASRISKIALLKHWALLGIHVRRDDGRTDEKKLEDLAAVDVPLKQWLQLEEDSGTVF
jgi:hypothetical protein